MKISIVVNGTRGDVQPMIALANGLQKNGHEIIFCAPPENEELIKAYNCHFVAFGPNYKEIFKKVAIKGGATTRPSLKSMKLDIVNQIDLLPGILKDSGLLLGVGFVLGLHTVADILKIPYRFIIFYPSILGPAKTDSLFYRLLFGLGRSMTNMAVKSFINKKRKSIGLNPINDVWSDWMGDDVIAACDKELNAVKESVAFKYTQTGYMPLFSKNSLPENVKNFIDAGKPPVFISFGSNPISRPERFVGIFNEVAKTSKQRLIISKGWADLPDNNTPEVLYVDEMPYELLFPSLAAIVHHGGTGTMAIAARAGIPQVAFPFMADQFENRKQIVKLELGPNACNFKKMNADALNSAILECVNNEKYKQNAMKLAKKLEHSDGLDSTIKLVENLLK